MDKYMMVDPDAESLQEKIAILDHLTHVKEIDYVSEVDKQMDKLQKELKCLREQKAKFETEEALKSFEDGEYYRLDDRGGCLSYYFKYSKSNFHVQDMTGTVGYTGENDVIISHGLKVFATRAQYQAGFFHSLYLHL